MHFALCPAGSLIAVEGDKSQTNHIAADSARLIRRWFNDLSDDEPVIREEARQSMMSLRRKDLGALRTVVKQHIPLLPSEADGLRDLVTHIFLTESSYDREESVGFLGVIFEEEQQYLSPECGGVEIRRRLPGFCGYRYLQNGDVVLRVGEAPATLQLRDYDQLSQAVQTYSSGQTVNFEILRNGRIIQVPIVLDAKPKLVRGIGIVEEFESLRRSEADRYWEEEFAPLFEAQLHSASLER